MFRFENSDWLWALAGLPVLIGIFILQQYLTNQSYKKLGSENNLKEIYPLRSKSRMIWKSILLSLAYTSLTIALANPQYGTRMEKVKIKGAEIFIALDVSNSMLADDIKPSRIDRAKIEIIQLMKQLRNDRIGLIIFAGRAFTPIPLTTDYAMVKMYLRGIDTDIISTQGTDIGAAINIASESFSKDESKNKALIIITDGENHEESAIEQAKELANKGVSIHTIGLGSTTGVPIPVYNKYGNKNFRKDKEGNVVVSKLNEQILNELAQIGSGQYIKANNSGMGLKALYKSLKGMEKQDLEEKVVTEYEDHFQLYLWIAIALLTLEQIILPRKNKLLTKVKILEARI